MSCLAREGIIIILNKMDHSKIASPHFFHKNKTRDSFTRLPKSMIGMIVHGHGDNWYVHFGLDPYSSNSNHTMDSITKLLRDLEDVPKFASCHIFSSTCALPLLDALFEGSNICKSSLSLIKKNQFSRSSFPWS
jgi:hypothetical protein